MAEQPHVLVIGAGPVGLSAALALTREGVTVRVIDAGDTVDRRMRASIFHPPTLDMIDRFGLSARLVGLGRKVPRWQMRQHETGEFVTFDLELLEDATKHPFRLLAEQHRYCALVVDALRELGVSVEFQTRADSVEQDDDGVSTTMSSGEIIRAEWVVGADGSHGATRKSVGLAYGGRTCTHLSVLVSTTFPFEQYLNELSDISDCWSNHGAFSLLHLKNCWHVILNPDDKEFTAATKERQVRERLAQIHPDARDSKILGISPYRVHERCVERFRVGRVLLAGDAAHLNPPSGGMGMNGGIHDAMNLAEKLVAVLNGANDALLDRYDRQRRHVACERVIPRASASRASMSADDVGAQARRLARYRAVRADRKRSREFLLASSMISALREAEAIE